MASYFDVAPAKAGSRGTAADYLDEGDRAAIGDMGLMSPQVARILEAMELEEGSSSESNDEGDDDDDVRHGENTSLSARGSPSQINAATNQHPSPQPVAARQSNGSLLHKALRAETTKQNAIPGTPPPSDQPTLKSSKKSKSRQKQPDLSRFQSLRTMLFNSHIEEHMEKQKEELAKEEAEKKWKKDFEARKGLERTPSSEKAEEKRGVMKRMGTKLKRLASKDVTSVNRAQHDSGNASSASSDDEPNDQIKKQRKHSNPKVDDTITDSDEEEINHSDIEDIVRWVSRKDPPSDGEARSKKETPAALPTTAKEDSGHESLGNSDVDELVRWVSRRSSATPPQAAPPSKSSEPSTTTTVAAGGPQQHNYSSASTETDTSGPTVATTRRRTRGDTINHKDVDDLVRWVSSKEVPTSSSSTDPKPSHAATTAHDDTAAPDLSSDEDEEETGELIRWVTHRDDTSGESDVENTTTSPASHSPSPSPDKQQQQVPPQKKQGRGSALKQEVLLSDNAEKSHASLTHDDVDDLVRWVSRRNTNVA